MKELFTPLVPEPSAHELPRRFPSPFDARTPHPLAVRAAAALAAELTAMSPSEGKMFAVLVVREAGGRIGFLRGFSGMLDGEWEAPGFVPPMFERYEHAPWWLEAQAQLRRWEAEWSELAHGPRAAALRAERTALLAAQQLELDALKLRHRERRAARRALREELERAADTTPASPATAARQHALRDLDRQSSHDGAEERDCKSRQRAARDELDRTVAALDARRDEIASARAAASAGYQRRLNDLYQVPSCDGQTRPLREVFAPGNPPGGAGDCAGPKLLAYALGAGMTPLVLAEMWWGPPPLGGGRHHGQLYPACRGKCGPLLPVMLRGLEVEAAPIFGAIAAAEGAGDDGAGDDGAGDDGAGDDGAGDDGAGDDGGGDDGGGDDGGAAAESDAQSQLPATLDLGAAAGGLEILYEDETLVAIAKPCGLLSVPGRSPELHDSVLTRLRARYPQATGPLLVHRLDLDTSGLLLAAKDAASHTLLQRQFAHREIEKRYLAIVDGELREDGGVIQLALRTDVEDRPRQIYDPVHGKLAITHWHVVERGAGTTRVALFPHTGRTHQLRVHAAHPLGLAAPILGDRLYGRAAARDARAQRLLLHAERLAFVHPKTGRRLELAAPAPF